MWAPPPPERPTLGWWTELSRDRWIAGIDADLRDKKQAKRRAQNRRRAQTVKEAMCLAETSVGEARRYLSRYGGVESRSRPPDERSSSASFVGRPLSPCELYLRGEI